MLTLSLVKGTSRDFPLQANNPDGTPALNLFLSGDTLALKVWRGDSLALVTVGSASVAWISAPLGTFQVTFNDADTSALEVAKYRIQVTAARSGRSAVLLDAYLDLTAAPGSETDTNLVSQNYLAAALGDMNLTRAQLDILPQVTAAASRLIRKHCNRYFNRTTYDGLYTLDWPSRAILLRHFPVNSVNRVRMSAVQVINVTNTNTANQQAVATLITTGVQDVDDIPPTVTGLKLWSIASGVPTTVNLTFTANETLGGLMTAINAVGNGWSASIDDSTYTNWPVSDLRSGFGPSSAIGSFDRFGFQVHVQDVPVEMDLSAGMIYLTQSPANPFTSNAFGGYLSTDLGDVQIFGGLNGVRVIYDAGWDTVPEDVQQATVETVQDMMNLLNIDQRIQSEADGAYSYSLAPINSYALTPSVRGKVGYYRSIRV